MKDTSVSSMSVRRPARDAPLPAAPDRLAEVLVTGLRALEVRPRAPIGVVVEDDDADEKILIKALEDADYLPKEEWSWLLNMRLSMRHLYVARLFMAPRMQELWKLLKLYPDADSLRENIGSVFALLFQDGAAPRLPVVMFLRTTVHSAWYFYSLLSAQPSDTDAAAKAADLIRHFGIGWAQVSFGHWTRLVQDSDAKAHNNHASRAMRDRSMREMLRVMCVHEDHAVAIRKGWFNQNVWLDASYLPPNLKYIREDAFNGCTNLKTLRRLPDKLVFIGERAFMTCEGLNIENIPDGVKKIESHTFAHCNSLVSPSLPKSLVSLGAYAFVNCKNLDLEKLPDKVEEIEVGVFQGCSALRSLKNLPEGLTELEHDAFRLCAKLDLATLPQGIKKIKSSTFSGCSSLVSPLLPDELEEIGEYAFSSCTNLRLPVLPDTVTTIEDFAFGACHNFAATRLPSSLEVIGKGAFMECLRLAITYLPDGSKEFGMYAFHGCISLALTDVPPSFKDNTAQVGDSAFSGCISMELEVRCFLARRMPWANAPLSNTERDQCEGTV